MCTNPIFRLNCEESFVRGRLPYFMYRRIKSNGIILRSGEYEVCCRLQLQDFIQELPCGRCAACRLNRALQWQARCMLEARNTPFNYFITLTYNDDNVPLQSVVVPATGQVIKIPVLLKRDYQLFLKSVRKASKAKFRFYLGGEYGDKNGRPHFHLLTFGLPLNDLIYFKRIGKTAYYRSPFLEKFWKKGFILVTPFAPSTAKYVANYTSKRRFRETPQNIQALINNVHSLLSPSSALNFLCRADLIQREFNQASNRPGLARTSFEDFEDFYLDYDKLPPGLKLPVMHLTYYDRIVKERYPDLWRNIVANRISIAKAFNYAGQPPDEYRKNLEENLLARERMANRCL